jgi:hypothetical protein
MNIQKGRDYEQAYGLTRDTAANWAKEDLTITLQALLSSEDKTEGTWGTIDALADLLHDKAL